MDLEKKYSIQEMYELFCFVSDDVERADFTHLTQKGLINESIQYMLDIIFSKTMMSEPLYG